jgi:RNA polymerase sigma factor (sigma-70 family)
LKEDQKDIDRLVALCRERDRNAQFQLYKRYYKAMYNTALRIIGDADQAEDIMQEAFLKAFTRLDSFKGDVAFGAWLKRIVINEAIDQLKKKDSRQETALEPVLYKTEDVSAFDDSGNDHRDGQVKKIKEAIASLKESYRTALTLLFIEGFDQEEIAGILSINAGNCRTLISRAKESLRMKLNML